MTDYGNVWEISSHWKQSRRVTGMSFPISIWSPAVRRRENSQKLNDVRLPKLLCISRQFPKCDKPRSEHTNSHRCKQAEEHHRGCFERTHQLAGEVVTQTDHQGGLQER